MRKLQVPFTTQAASLTSSARYAFASSSLAAETVMAGSGWNLEPSQAYHSPIGHWVGKHLTETAQQAQALLVPLPAVGLTCHDLVEARYSNHISPAPILRYTVTFSHNSSVGSYTPLISAALIPVAPSTRTLLMPFTTRAASLTSSARYAFTSSSLAAETVMAGCGWYIVPSHTCH